MPSKYRETVIDGYNLIHKLRNIPPGEPMATMRERLEVMLSRYRQKSRRHVTVVYDGGGGPRPHSLRSSVEVVYSGSLKSADRWIIDHARSLEPHPADNFTHPLNRRPNHVRQQCNEQRSLA